MKAKALPSSMSSTAIWIWPASLGALMLSGLISALLGQHGVWLAVSWISLSMPLAVITVCLRRAWSRPSSKGGPL